MNLTAVLICAAWMRAHVPGWEAAEHTPAVSPVVEIRANGVCIGSLPSGAVARVRCNTTRCVRLP